MREFAFELELCAALEERREGIVARQLGASVANPGGRIVDVVIVEPGPQFDRRRALTAETIPDVLLAADIGPGRWTPWRTALDCHPDRAHQAVEHGVEIGYLERTRRNGRDCVRQVARYPTDWTERLVAIENKPDLGTPGDLERQLRTDVSLALVDEIVLATESYVTGAHLNRIPPEVGVWRVHREGDDDIELPTIEVVREPSPLPVEEPGIEPLASHPGRTDIGIVSPVEKATARRRLAERAYGKGWRTYAFPPCASCSGTDVGGNDEPTATLPNCSWKERAIDAASECGTSCPGYEPADPVAVDLVVEREARTPWVADPEPSTRRQVGLDRFGD
ncbi:hypothetical protein C479_05868 [Halovivax asiaticus JCM 14624]|uniref:Uncharacterized protein n=1 Tax=Halovivax asiaticus JCM 14624 TaxID=1227490 RepID=M0BN33_9EURY|nr:DUF5787 family protein [Halovivax asiaticus]ELZ12311.1 hypothetical protein C479_05868 [Halovivax asiaticus JCM 14624]